MTVVGNPPSGDPYTEPAPMGASGDTARLRHLTAGEASTGTFRGLASSSLRRAQERWQQSGASTQAFILDALPANIAVLNMQGVIVATNASWREFGVNNGAKDADQCLGTNYLSVCDAASGPGAEIAHAAAAGVRLVLSGASNRFSFEYCCETPTETLWFLSTTAPLDEYSPHGAIVMHLDITGRKRGEENVSRLAAAMDTSPDAIFLIDRASMSIVHVNEAGCRLHNLSREQLLALSPWEVYGDSREAMEQRYDAIIAGGASEVTETQWGRNGGEPLWIETRRHAVLIGGRWTIVSHIRDVTARREAQSRIAYLNRIYAFLRGINTLIVGVRERGVLFRETCRIAVEEGGLAMAWIGMVDPGREHLVEVGSAGMDDELLALIRQRLALKPLSSPADPPTHLVIRTRQAFVSNDIRNDVNIDLMHLHVKYGIQSIAVLPLLVADEAAGVLFLHARESGFFHDKQIQLLAELAGNVAFAMEHIDEQDRLDYLARYDEVTGLANRRLFLERVSTHVRRAATADHKLAVCFIDLERFKNINESLGRGAGDALLKQVAQWLTAYAGDVNKVARIDADRFAVVLPVLADEQEIARSLEEAMKALAHHPFLLNGTSYRLAAKLGVALYPDDAIDADVLFANAEVALKKAKVGGDRYLFYAQRMTETVVGRLNLENQLRQALELDQFVLHYQPKMDVATGLMVGAEALIRWNDPHTGLVPPGRFIPILEETGLIHDVGRWALNQAMQDYLAWRNAGLAAVRIAVNVSPLQLRSRDFIAEIRAILSRDPHAAAGLELELTESLLMQDVQLSIATLQVLRDLGVRIAIDDFGTGFSSLSYLAKLPVDTVKIDRSFVMNMQAGTEGQTLVSIIINLAHSLKLKVVAEGVETGQQAGTLRSLRCDEMQGFWISRPLAAADFQARYLQPPLA
jgi:diguanylate cyclase (GGDEF)-like protein/PAS domain S-box-containing protein